MKYIPLTTYKKSPLDALIQIGCGPNFVFNRQDDFKAMIQDQGLIFWFRLWLTFCLRPVSVELLNVYQHCPSAWFNVNMAIHNQFLKGSVEDSIKYCLDTALPSFKALDLEEETPPRKQAEANYIFQNVLEECTAVAFGATMCVVFYKWLFAPIYQPQKHQHYWRIPPEYLEFQFRPRSLEKFLLKEWDENLLTFLECDTNQVHWLWDNLNPTINIDLDSFCDDISVEDKYPGRAKIHEMTKLMRKKFFQLKSIVHEVDELPKHTHVEKQFLRRMIVKWRRPAISSVESEDNFAQVCWFCGVREKVETNIRMCRRCLDSDWKHVRCYCSKACQMEHWFQAHYREHTNYAIKKQLKRNCNRSGNEEKYSRGGNEEKYSRGGNKKNYSRGGNEENCSRGGNEENCSRNGNEKNYSRGGNEENCSRGGNEENCSRGSNEQNCSGSSNEENCSGSSNEENCNRGSNDENFNRGSNDEISDWD